MLQPRLLHTLSLLFFLGTVTVVIFFLLSLQLAPFMEELIGDASPTEHIAVGAVRTHALPTATLQPLTLDLLTPVASPTLLATPTITMAATQSLPLALPASTPKIGIINSDLVNIRSYPSLAGDVVGQARQGEEVTIIAISTDSAWLHVCCPLGTSPDNPPSWIATEFVAVTP